MAKLAILEYPDERLRTVAKPVETFDDQLQTFIDDMFETMYEAPGIGLAASQVDYHQRLVVIDVSEEGNEPLVFINPEILEKKGSVKAQEGCLSVPDAYEKVERAEWVKVKAQDRHGNEFELETDGLLAICIQHEMDHLMGKLFVDYLSSMKLERVRKGLTKRRRRASDS